MASEAPHDTCSVLLFWVPHRVHELQQPLHPERIQRSLQQQAQAPARQSEPRSRSSVMDLPMLGLLKVDEGRGNANGRLSLVASYPAEPDGTGRCRRNGR